MRLGFHCTMTARLALFVCASLLSQPQPVAAQGFKPSEAAAVMTTAEGFEVCLVASEPLVRQPVAIEFDDRGRLWVIQYLQYPNPAGLERVEVDRYSRTKYDRVPKPPPHGPVGADRITILEDRDGDGRMDDGRDFVSGLNLASGLAFGHGGVFVLNVPYLLFYPDRNRDDVPDSDPKVLLTGFGMEDAHSVANSLTWGPDGWLYGCQGSTVTANIRGIQFQQGVWRYHPVTKKFELFCEGGGNAWGLDFDSKGRLLYSTNYGGYVLVHGVQGGYYVKSFAKHGGLHNPFTYGYFEHAPHRNFHGGHVTVGGLVYQGDSFPAEMRGKYIAGDLLGHGVYWHDIQPHGSTVRTSHGGELLVANDTWFAPTDVVQGPDGAIYVSDWHDARTAHPDPDADWDRTNGRIYRIAATGTKPAGEIDLARLSTDELLDLHAHENQWHVRRARMELAHRAADGAVDADSLVTVAKRLRETAKSSPDQQAALEALWSLYVVGGFDEKDAAKLLDSPYAAVRGWTVRLLGDRRTISHATAHRLDRLAETEPDVEVRLQLACTARRLPAADGVPIINANINRDIDHDDPFLPLSWWWAVERHSVEGREEVLKRFTRPTLWQSRLGRDMLLPKLVRRYATEATADGLDSLVRLIVAAPSETDRRALWQPMLAGWKEQSRDGDSPQSFDVVISHPFSQHVLGVWRQTPADLTLIELAILLGHREPLEAAVDAAFDRSHDPARRRALLNLLAQTEDAALIDPSLDLVRSNATGDLRSAALGILARFDNADVNDVLLDTFHASSERFRSQLVNVFLSRESSALVWLMAVDRGEIAPEAATLEQIRRVALLKSPQLDALVAKHWGQLRARTTEEKLAEVRRLNNDVRAAPGDVPAGHRLFKKHCAACHQLFGEGERVGPDLTTANRQDRQFLLISLVDPDSVIRKEYVSVVIHTTAGRVLTGLPVARGEAGITLVDAKGQRLVVASSDIDEMQESPLSLMPSDLYRQFKPQELRDLFAYLQSEGGH